MERLNLSLQSSEFNLIWRSLHALERELLQILEKSDEESDAYVFAANDLVYLAGLKEIIEEDAKKVFRSNAFILTDELAE